MKLIQHYEATGNISSLNLSSIPTDGTYTDLLLVCAPRFVNGGGGGLDMYMTFNGSTTGYTENGMYSIGSAEAAYKWSLSGIRLHSKNNAISGLFGNFYIYISNYTSNAKKVVTMDMVFPEIASEAVNYVQAGEWNNSSAINSIQFDPESSFVISAGSTFSLYGITAGSDGVTTVS